MQKAKLEIFVQCLAKTLVQFLLQAGCRLSHEWEENTNADICSTHWLSITKLVLNQLTWVVKVEQHSVSTAVLCSEGDHSELVSSLPVSPWPSTGSHSSVPGQTACTSLEIWFMTLDTRQHVCGSCLGHLLPGWQGVGERLGELQWKHWERSRERESWKQGGAQKFHAEKDPVGNAGHTECKSGENYNSLVTLFTGLHFFNYIFFSSKKRQIVPALSCSHYVPIIILILIVYQLNFTLKGW